MYRRTRKPNYTLEETDVLLQQLGIYGNFLFGKHQQGLSNHQRADMWSKIAAEVNTVSNSAERTVEELKHRWKDLSHRARNALRAGRIAAENGKQSPIMPPLYFEKILKILGETPPQNVFVRRESRSASSCKIESSNNFCSEALGDTSSKVDPDSSHVESDLPNIGKVSKFELEKSPPPVKGNVGKSIQKFSRVSQRKRIGPLKHILPRPHQYQSESTSMPVFPEPSNLGHALSSSSAIDSQNISCVSKFPSAVSSEVQGGASYFSTLKSSSRPMVLDPETQLVLELDNPELSAESEGDDNSLISSRMNGSAEDYAEDADAGDVDELGHQLPGSLRNYHRGETDATSPLQSPSNMTCNTHLQRKALRRKRKLRGYSSNSHDVSLEELQKQYIISKMNLVSEQRNILKLEEKKLEMELQLLQNKLLSIETAQQSLSSNPYTPFPVVNDAAHYHGKLKRSRLKSTINSLWTNSHKRMQRLGKNRFYNSNNHVSNTVDISSDGHNGIGDTLEAGVNLRVLNSQQGLERDHLDGRTTQSHNLHIVKTEAISEPENEKDVHEDFEGKNDIEQTGAEKVCSENVEGSNVENGYGEKRTKNFDTEDFHNVISDVSTDDEGSNT